MAFDKYQARVRRKVRIHKKISGTPERPRLVVYRSLKHIYAQLTDEVARKTLVSVSSLSKEFGDKKNAGNCKGAKTLGQLLAKKAKSHGIEQVVFDRNGFLYHGRVKALADAAREGGLKF